MSPTTYYGSLLAIGTLAVAAALLYWQWAERRGRGPDLSDQDFAHFRNQDLRRWVVAGVMTLLSAGVYLGSRMPYKQDGHPNTLFVETWLAIFVLVLVLIGLAFFDWLATRNYALRHRSEIVREGVDILRDEIRLRVGHASNGRSSQDFKSSPPG